VREAANRSGLAWRTLLKPLVHLLTAYNSLHESIASIAIPSMRRLAGANNYSFEAVRRDDCLRNVGWIKIDPIRDALAGNTDYELWLDIDALPVRYDADIRAIANPDADLHLSWHQPAAGE
jgi:hypothetical protein